MAQFIDQSLEFRGNRHVVHGAGIDQSIGFDPIIQNLIGIVIIYTPFLFSALITAGTVVDGFLRQFDNGDIRLNDGLKAFQSFLHHDFAIALTARTANDS